MFWAALAGWRWSVCKPVQRAQAYCNRAALVEWLELEKIWTWGPGVCCDGAALVRQMALEWVRAGEPRACCTRAALEEWLYLVCARALGHSAVTLASWLDCLDHVPPGTIKVLEECKTWYSWHLQAQRDF